MEKDEIGKGGVLKEEQMYTSFSFSGFFLAEMRVTFQQYIKMCTSDKSCFKLYRVQVSLLHLWRDMSKSKQVCVVLKSQFICLCTCTLTQLPVNMKYMKYVGTNE